MAGRNPWKFFRDSRRDAYGLFHVFEQRHPADHSGDGPGRIGNSAEVAGFVLPLGATLNMNGTALFEGATVLFLAQVFGVSLSLGQQLVVVIMSVITAIGVAGVPGGSIPLLMMVIGMVGVPMEGIAIILGVDRLLDMCRTVLNVSGDLVTSAIVARVEGKLSS